MRDYLKILFLMISCLLMSLTLYARDSEAISESSQGYHSSSELAEALFKKYIDYDSQMLMAQTKIVWAASLNNIGAKNSSYFLRLIDPNSKSGAEA